MDEDFLSLEFCYWNGDLLFGNVVYVHLFYCMDFMDDSFFHRYYGQSLADTPEYVCVEDEEWLVREGLGERAGDKCRGYKDNRKNCQNGSSGDLACTAAGFALWAVVDSGSLACYDG